MSSNARPASRQSQLATTPAAQAPTKLAIAPRKSRLVLWRAEHVRTTLQKYYPTCDVFVLGITTCDGQILGRSLAEVGGKGLFVKELEIALTGGYTDLAVHSPRDTPMELPGSFALSAILKHEGPHNAFISDDCTGLASLSADATMGTSGLCREASLGARFPHLMIQPLQDNLDTRLGKLDRGDYTAIILAATELKRLGLVDRVRSTIAPEESLPAIGQGALGIEVRTDHTGVRVYLALLHDEPIALAITAEHTVPHILGGSYQVPLASFTQWSDGGTLRLRTSVASQDGTRKLAADSEVAPSTSTETDTLGVRVAQQMLTDGARDILVVLGADAPPAA